MLMNKYYKIILIGLFFSANIFAGEIREKAEKIIVSNFSESVEIKTYKLTLNKSLKYKTEKFAKQRFLTKFVYYYEIKENNKKVGTAILDNVLGKVKPITYLIIFLPDKSIKSVNVVKYREQYGGSIGKRNWLKQFDLKTIDNQLLLNQEIDGISGATISVKSIIKGVKRMLYLINNLEENEKDLFVSVE